MNITGNLVSIFKYLAIIAVCVTLIFVSHQAKFIKYENYKSPEYEYTNIIYSKH